MMVHRILLAALLVLAAPSVTLAAPVGTCVLSPNPLAAGGTETAVCSGWGRGEAMFIEWGVKDSAGVYIFSTGYPLTAGSDATFTTSQVIPVAGTGRFFAQGPQNPKHYSTSGPVGFRSFFQVTP